ncbi:MAG TPA: rod shape-determining protein MreC [Firmicutes bacterium]|uniref:Cell shape-determining protein MreC n=1 Tax=Candidatus Fermentithermobacillus carboniphilus TaxID=3085328 RepID=A0AAT9LA64_9FIRM|nr:MAG: rod shape-determining protein MreC [Candidatus Fermentithermobacillus carboniphilus]HHW18822.1 rod shape-determining protein MreC [Candidatus Fermentithermobacillaceae bacterium]
MRRLFPYKKAILTALLLAASVFLMNVTGKPQQGPSFWETLCWKAAGPAIGVFQKAKEWSLGVSVAFRSKKALMEENQKLKEEIETLSSLKPAMENLLAENARLKELLQFKESSPGEYKVAKVIGRNPTKWFSTLVISLGTKDGVLPDAPVMSRSGLVGRVLSCDDDTATVLLLTDPESGVGALVSRSREYGVVLGGSGSDRLVLRFFSRDADVASGDKIFTSGMGKKYPAGIYIGEVTEVYVPKPGLVKECVVKPATDFDHLEEVLVKIR